MFELSLTLHLRFTIESLGFEVRGLGFMVGGLFGVCLGFFRPRDSSVLHQVPRFEPAAPPHETAAATRRLGLRL